MRNKSFFLTTPQYRDGSKTCTRHQCNRTPPVGEKFMGIVKGQGIPKDEHIEKLHVGEYVNVRWERIDAITQEDVVKEGFPDKTPEWFIAFYCKANKCKPSDLCCRQEFKHLTVVKVGDQVSLAKYAKAYPIEFKGDRIPTDPCVITSIDDTDNMPPHKSAGWHVTDALGRLWFCYSRDEFELL